MSSRPFVLGEMLMIGGFLVDIEMIGRCDISCIRNC